MIAILSPAKSILDLDKTVPCALECSKPSFLKDSSELIKILKTKSRKEIGTLMHVSEAIADLNFKRYKSWKKTHNETNSRHAVLAFSGPAFIGLDAASFSENELLYSQNHLRILSGLYGILKPLDFFQDYRLEMGTTLENENGTNLYHFWGDKLRRSIQKELNQDDNILVNLASNEYSKALQLDQLKAKVITCHFMDQAPSGDFKVIMAFAKKARGLMSRFIIKNEIKNPEELLAFDYDGYFYDAKRSTENELYFLRNKV